jgi:hypothetical protein
MLSGPHRIVKALLHGLTPLFLILLIAVIPAGCGGGYDPPDTQLPNPVPGDDPEPEPLIELEGQWKLISLSSDSARTDLEASGLDVVLEIAADGTARWHVKEDGVNYFYCSADDMVLTLDQEVNDQVNLSYHHVLIDPQTGQVTRNGGLQEIHFTAVVQDGALIELADGHPPQGIVMLPEFDAYNEQDVINLTVTAADVDLSDSAPTLDSASLCDIKFDTVYPPDSQPPEITRFELSGPTPTTDPAISFILEGQDNVAVSAWLVSESDATPAVDDAAWSGAAPQGYTLSAGYGIKTVYAWAKDVRGNISDPAFISVEYIAPPDPPDTQPPVITLFALTSAATTPDPAITFDLEGQDNVAVSAWLVNETDTTPAVDDAAWSGSKPQGHTLSAGYGMKTVYAWAKDASGNISDSAAISVEYIDPPDTQAPVITRFELSSATPTTDPAITFDLEGQDNVAVSAWLINESDATPAVDDAAWSGTIPQSHTLSAGYGMKTVYAWAKDASGNISASASFSVEYMGSCVYVDTTVLPTNYSPVDGRVVRGGLSHLFSDDNEFLEMDARSFFSPMYLTVDFEFDPMDVTDLEVSVSSLGSNGDFQRTISVLNYVTGEDTLVESAREVNTGQEVRSDISLAGTVENISDYLEQNGDRLTFRLNIRLDRTNGSDNHYFDLVQLTVTHPEDPYCIDQ